MANNFVGAMIAMSEEIANEPSWQRYAEYCHARANKHGERAASAAAQFAESARPWSFEERKRFGLWLMTRTGSLMEQCGRSRFTWRFSSGGPGLFAPRTVIETVLWPTLAEWRAQDPTNPEPHFWLGLYDENPTRSLMEAMRLDPVHGGTRAALVLMVTNSMEYSQHELPSGYLGEPGDDLIRLDETAVLLTDAVAPDTRQMLEAQISRQRAAAEDWIRLRGQLTGLDWAARIAIWRGRALHRAVQ